MNKTSIEWTRGDDGSPGFSANPLKYRRKSDGKTVWACVKTSPGCANCYAEAITLRYVRGKLFNAKNMEELEPFLDDAELRKMLNAKTVGGVPVSGSRCFVGDMTDVFGEWVPDVLLDRLFAVFALRPDVTFQVLTKRAARMAYYLADAGDNFRQSAWEWHAADIAQSPCAAGIVDERNFPLENVWPGVSVENRKCLTRIDHLRQTPASLRFLSLEPLLEDLGQLDLGGIGWVIVGGESGHGARPMHSDWVRSVRDQCVAAGVPFFFKQHGEWLQIYDRDGDEDARNLPDMKNGSRRRWLNITGGHGFHGDRVLAVESVGKKVAGRLLDGREWNEMPKPAAVPV